MNARLTKLLNEWDKTIEIWNNIPKEPLVLDEEEVDWTDDSWTVDSLAVMR